MSATAGFQVEEIGIISDKIIRFFRRAVTSWEKENGASFPWRNTSNRWHALVAEIMLQRTRAEQVVPVYVDFCNKYKTPTEYLSKKNHNIFSSLGLNWRNRTFSQLAQELANEIPDDTLRLLELPGIGSAYGFGGKKEAKELYFTFSNYITPGTIYKYDPESGNSEIFKKPDVKFNSEDYESNQVFYESRDGTKVPMIITYKKGTVMDGKNPTILYGYGGFDISLTPSFSIVDALWLELGGIYAVPNIRGGGEYGEKWHLAGTKLNKQNVFDDFIAAGEYLIDNNYT